jgi:hypothetical protein
MRMGWNMQRSQLPQGKLSVRLTYKYKGYHNPSSFAFRHKLIKKFFHQWQSEDLKWNPDNSFPWRQENEKEAFIGRMKQANHRV